MKIDRYMVNLFFEIRRNLPLALQEEMTISNPSLGDQMVSLYRVVDDRNIKLLIKVFLQRAGEDWTAKLSQKKRLYRGAEIAKSSPPKAPTQSVLDLPSNKAKPKRIYRGQVVE